MNQGKHKDFACSGDDDKNKDINIWIKVNTQYLHVLMMIMKKH